MIVALAKLGLASELKRCAEDRIEKAIATMQLKKTQAKLLTKPLPDHEEILLKLQTEYDELLVRISEFTEAKKAWLLAKKSALPEMGSGVDIKNLKRKYKFLKQVLAEQKQQWQSLNAQLAVA